MGRLAAARAVTGGRSLAGRRVLVTRAADQAADLVDALRAKGAEVVHVPLLAIAPPPDPRGFDEAVRSLGSYDWLLLTSANAAQAVARGLGPEGRLPATLRIASSGPATTAVIRSLFPGTAVSAQATSRFGSPGLAEALALVDVRGSRMLLPVSDRSPAAIGETLRGRGARVDVVVAYRTAADEAAGPALRAALDDARGLDALTFASPSAVEAFVGSVGVPRDVPAVVIGPTTAAAARSAGLTVAGTAEPETTAGLVEALEKHFEGFEGSAGTRKSP